MSTLSLTTITNPLDGSDIGANFKTIRDFLNGTNTSGLDANNLASTVRLKPTQLAEAQSLSTYVITLSAQSGIAESSKTIPIPVLEPATILSLSVIVKESTTGTKARAVLYRTYKTGETRYLAYADNDSAANVTPHKQVLRTIQPGAQLWLTLGGLTNVSTATAVLTLAHGHTDR